MADDAPPDVDAFLARWQAAQASERANAQLFLSELADLLGIERPGVATGTREADAYVFERPVRFHDGPSETVGFIDLYRRGALVLETKQGVDAERAATGKKQRRGHGTRGTAAWEATMEAAKNQAARYARNLEPGEPVPPFLVVADVGYCIDLYADFGGTGRIYAPFPSATTYRITLADLHKESVRERLRRVFEEPLSLDPARHQARVTRELAAQLAALASSLDAGGQAEAVSGFLSRCLFCMFAEDAGLIPERAFGRLLEAYRDDVGHLPAALSDFFGKMDAGGFVGEVRVDLPVFNGGLFRERFAPPLTADHLDRLTEAAHMDWSEVEPSIFGTLLERALDPSERHALGAHYTPRAYVERLVGPAVLEPLRAEWDGVRAAVEAAETEAEEATTDRTRTRRREEAREAVRGFLRRLASLRVLDPACGSGNFLYVTFAGLKALEGEVRAVLRRLGGTDTLEMEGAAVTPRQMLGIEVNARAAAIADLVLWIGYLQWHRRTYGAAQPLPEPILQGYGQVEHRDAVLADDGTPAEWPEADFIIGNPPFLGKGEPMRRGLGAEYLGRLADAYPHIAASADFVLYWWDRAAAAVRAGGAERFGLITTNSLTQTFNRRVTAPHLDGDGDSPPLALAFAVPDHPWVDSADGAAVRVAMTVGSRADSFDPEAGRLAVVTDEREAEGVAEVSLTEYVGCIHADLTVGADVTAAEPLDANASLSSFGVMLAGRGFVLSPEEAAALGRGPVAGAERVLRPLLNGRDLTSPARERYVVDFFGLSADEAREQYPEAYEHLLRTVKPERDKNRRQSRREHWWLFGEPNPKLRKHLSGLGRFIATPETARHRVFQFIPADTLPEHKLFAIGTDDAMHLGVLSSSVHVEWALASGGRLGAGNDPVYNTTLCFRPFPFPAATDQQTAEIRALGEAIDAHRKDRQALHPDLGLTDIYNAVEALRAGRDLSPKEQRAAVDGLAHTLLDLHRRLDRAVLDAYGWSDLDAEAPSFRAAVLSRLVALNAERRAEEAQGHVRYLRPSFQNPGAGGQTGLGLATDTTPADEVAVRRPWPTRLAEQTVAVRQAVEALGAATPAAVAARFEGASVRAVTPVLEALAGLGLIRETAPGSYSA